MAIRGFGAAVGWLISGGTCGLHQNEFRCFPASARSSGARRAQMIWLKWQCNRCLFSPRTRKKELNAAKVINCARNQQDASGSPARRNPAKGLHPECLQATTSSPSVRATTRPGGLRLPRRGRQSVLVLERNAWFGGGVVTAELTGPGYLHDRFSTGHIFIQGNPLIKMTS